MTPEMKEPNHKSDAFESIHVSVRGLFSVGMIDAAKMLEYDRACLMPAVEVSGDNSQTKVQTNSKGSRSDDKFVVPK